MVRSAIEINDAVKYSTRLEPTFEDIVQELRNIGAGGGESTTHDDIVIVCRPRCRHLLLLRNTHAADGAARSGDTESRAFRLFEADALEDRMHAVPIGQSPDVLDTRSFHSDVSCLGFFFGTFAAMPGMYNVLLCRVTALGSR